MFLPLLLALMAESAALPNPVPPPPASFRSADFLRSHISSILDFYLPRCVDPSGGFYHCYTDDGTVYDRRTRHIVSSTRFVIVFLWAARLFPHDDRLLPLARHGLAFLKQKHKVAHTGGYRWEMKVGEGQAEAGGKEELGPNYSYAMAFVLLTYSTAVQSGLKEYQQDMEETCRVWDQHMWEEQPGLYADEANTDWSVVSSYRGQNCVRHEALTIATPKQADYPVSRSLTYSRLRVVLVVLRTCMPLRRISLRMKQSVLLAISSEHV